MRYVVCIMAHNEERVIAETIDSVLQQETESDDSLDLYVFSNGCTDRTDDIIRHYESADPRVHLVSLPRKGKVYALRQSIAAFIRMHQAAPDFDRVFYVDADVTFIATNTLRNLSRVLDSSPDLYLVSSYPKAYVEPDATSWYLKLLAKVRQEVQSSFQSNVVRGACYVIRYSALRRVSYPKTLLSDDMFLEVRLNGHYLMDYSNPTVTKQKGTIKGEIQRDLFTLIAREQVYEWHRSQRVTSLDPQNARLEWSLSFGKPRDFAWHLIKKGRFLSLAVMASWLPIYKYNERRARLIIEESRRRKVNLLDYWTTAR